MALSVLEEIRAAVHDDVVDAGTTYGNEWIILTPSSLERIALLLRDTKAWAFDMPIDCTVVDELGGAGPRFRVVWHFYSTQHKHRLRVMVQLNAEAPQVASLTPLWPGMNWHEREAWDLYGVEFLGHPNLKRILMYEEFVGHPLRKDYPVDKRQPLVTMRTVREVPTQRRPPPEMLNRP